ELKRAMATNRLAASEVVRRLNASPLVRAEVTRAQVENWRAGKTMPELALIPDIARVVDMREPGSSSGASYDPMYILRRMGLVDETPDISMMIDTAYRLQKLQLK